MAEIKTKQTDASVLDFINSVDDAQKREDSLKLLAIFEELIGGKPKMWGPAIVGFGTYHYKYESGREGDWFLAGFSPRKQNISIYVMCGLTKSQQLLDKLGKHNTGKSCLYIKRLADVDESVLCELILNSVKKLETGNLSC